MTWPICGLTGAAHGGHLKTAIIAEETLREAERFTTMHGFLPIGISAQSDSDGFPGTAFFGTARDPFSPTGQEVIAGPRPGTLQSLPLAEMVQPSQDAPAASPAQRAARATPIDAPAAPAPRSATPPHRRAGAPADRAFYAAFGRSVCRVPAAARCIANPAAQRSARRRARPLCPNSPSPSNSRTSAGARRSTRPTRERGG